MVIYSFLIDCHLVIGQPNPHQCGSGVMLVDQCSSIDNDGRITFEEVSSIFNSSLQPMDDQPSPHS